MTKCSSNSSLASMGFCNPPPGFMVIENKALEGVEGCVTDKGQKIIYVECHYKFCFQVWPFDQALEFAVKLANGRVKQFIQNL